MQYVNCAQCGRPVMSFNVCAYCQTLDRSLEAKPGPFTGTRTRAEPMSPGGLALLAGLVAAGVAYWKTADQASAAVAGVVTGLLARTAIGQIIVKLALAAIGLGMIWLVWQFFSQLSKTYR